MTRKRSAYRPRQISAPVTRELHDHIGMGLHLTYEVLKTAPTHDLVEHLAQMLGMVGLAIEDDEKFSDQQRVIDAGMRVLEKLSDQATTPATETELVPLLNAVNVADRVVPRLDVLRLHNANLKLRALSML